MKRVEYIKLYKAKIKETPNLVLAQHESRKDGDGDPLFSIFNDLNFEKSYSKYGWKKVNANAKPPKEVQTKKVNANAKPPKA